MKIIKQLSIIISLLCILPKVHAQNSEVKVNLLAGAVTIFNPSLEIGFGKSSAITMDYVGAYAEEDFMNTGYPLLLSMGIFGYRYYTTKEKNHTGFFVGGDFGLDQFRMKKEVVPFVASGGNYAYDVGYGYLLGVSVGYKYNISRRFNIEASLSGGWHLAQHECYTSEGVRVHELNASAEWIPYKAGIYISYVFGS